MQHNHFCTRLLILLFFLNCWVFLPAHAVDSTATVCLQTAKEHPMQYYLSLPEGWSPTLLWPVLIVIADASKQYKTNAELFAARRKHLPFIIVAPIIVSNGSYGYRSPSLYPYTAETWDRIDKEGVCHFDLEGLLQVVKEVIQKYKGEEKAFLTGFEAGAHLVWAMTFLHPEKLRAVASVAGNYNGRCLDENEFSHDQAAKSLPVRSFYGEKDERWYSFLKQQNEDARNLALKYGYLNVSIVSIPNRGHTPMADEVINYFYSLYHP